MSKGSKRRPSFISEAELNDRWNGIWKKTPAHAKTQQHEDKRRKSLDKQLKKEQDDANNGE